MECSTVANCQELKQYLIWDSEGTSETKDTILEEMFDAVDNDDDSSDDDQSRGRKRKSDKKKSKKRKSSRSESPVSVSSALSESEAS